MSFFTSRLTALTEGVDLCLYLNVLQYCTSRTICIYSGMEANTGLAELQVSAIFSTA